MGETLKSETAGTWSVHFSVTTLDALVQVPFYVPLPRYT